MSASMQLQVAAAVPAELFTKFHPKVPATPHLCRPSIHPNSYKTPI